MTPFKMVFVTSKMRQRLTDPACWTTGLYLRSRLKPYRFSKSRAFVPRKLIPNTIIEHMSVESSFSFIVLKPWPFSMEIVSSFMPDVNLLRWFWNAAKFSVFQTGLAVYFGRVGVQVLAGAAMVSCIAIVDDSDKERMRFL